MRLNEEVIIVSKEKSGKPRHTNISKKTGTYRYVYRPYVNKIHTIICIYMYIYT